MNALFLFRRACMQLLQIASRLNQSMSSLSAMKSIHLFQLIFSLMLCSSWCVCAQNLFTQLLYRQSVSHQLDTLFQLIYFWFFLSINKLHISCVHSRKQNKTFNATENFLPEKIFSGRQSSLGFEGLREKYVQ